MANKETLGGRNTNKKRNLKYGLAATSAAALLALTANSCSDGTTKQQDKDEARVEVSDKQQTNQDDVQPATVNLPDVNVEPKEPAKPENEQGIEKSDEAKSAIKDYVGVLSKLNIKGVSNFEGVKKLSEANFKMSYHGQGGEYLEDDVIKKDKDGEYFIANGKKIRVINSNETAEKLFDGNFEGIEDGLYYADGNLYTISNNGKTYIKIYHRSGIGDEGGYRAEIIDHSNGKEVTYFEEEIHDQIFKLREGKFMGRFIDYAKGYGVYNFPRLFRFEGLGNMDPKDGDFSGTGIFYFKDGTIFKGTLLIDEDGDYLDLTFKGKGELISKGGKKEMVDGFFNLQEE